MIAYSDNPANAADLLDKLGTFLAGAQSGKKFSIGIDPLKILDELKQIITDLEHKVSDKHESVSGKDADQILSLIADQTNDTILVQDIDLRYRMVINPLLRLTAEGMMGKTDYDILPKHDADRLTNVKRQVITEGRVIPYSTSIKSKSGSEEFFNGSFIPTTDKNGQIDGLVGYFRNVTDLKRKERELERTIESIGDGFFALDKEWNFVYMNDAAEVLIGSKREDLIGKNHWEVYPEAAGTLIEKNYAFAAAGQTMEWENFYEPWNRWFHIRVYPREGGGVLSFFQDITERKEKEKKINKLNHVYSLLSKVNETILYTRDKNELLEQVCIKAISYGDYANVMIGMAVESVKYLMFRVIGEGKASFLKKGHIVSLDHKAKIKGPFSLAFLEGKTHFSNDIANDPKIPAVWKDSLIGDGFKSLCAVPLKEFGRTIGVLVVHCDRTNFFENDEMHLLEEVADNIGYALEGIETAKLQEETLQALASSETELKHAQHIARLGNWHTNLDGFIMFSEALCEIYGIDQSRNNIKLLEFIEMIHPDDRHLMLEWIEASHAGKKQGDLIYRIVRPDGEIKYIECKGEFFKGADGNPIYAAGTSQDITVSYLTEQEVREKEEQIRLILENSMDGIMLSAPNGSIYKANASMCNLLGMTEAEIIDKKNYGLVDPADSRLHAIIEERDRTGRVKGELNLLHKDGYKIPVELTSSIFADKNGYIMTSMIIRDIRERKKAEKEREMAMKQLRDSEKSLRIAHHIARLGSWTMDKDLNTSWSEEIYQYLGYDPASFEVSQDNIARIVHPDDSNKRDAWLKSLMEGENSGEIVFRVFGADGKPRTLSTWAESEMDEYGGFLGLKATVQDITERVRMEEALLESEMQNTLLLENSFHGIMSTGPDGSIFSANRAACDLYGMTEAELCAKGWVGILDNSDPRLERFLEEREHKGKARGEFNLRRKDGTLFPAEVSSIIYKNNNGELRTSLIFQDITKRKLAELAIIESEQKFSAAFRRSPATITLSIPYEGRFLDVNETFLRDMEYTRDEVIGHTSDELHIFNSSEELMEIRKALMENHIVNQMECGFRKKSGGLLIGLLSAVFVQIKGKPVQLTIVVDITEQKKAEEALRNSELKHRIVADYTYDWEYWIGPDNKFVYCSPSCYRITGYHAEEFLKNSKLVLDCIHPDDRKIFGSHQHEISGVNHIQDISFRILKPDGTIRWISHVCQVIYDENGNLLGRRGSNRDITERRKALEDLKISEERFRHISSTISDIAYSCIGYNKGEYHIDWIYGAVEKITGYTREEVQAMGCWGKLVAKEDMQIFMDHVIGIPVGQVDTSQMRLKRKDGKIIWIESTSECVQSQDDPEVSVLYGGIMDITNRKNAEDIIRQSEEKYRMLANNSADVIWMTDASGIYTYVSPSVEKLYGYKPDEAVGLSMIDAVPPELRESSSQQLPQTVKYIESVGPGIQPFIQELEQVRKDGSRFWVETLFKALFNDAGQFEGFLGITRDVSERKKSTLIAEKHMEEQLLLTRIAHQLVGMDSKDQMYSFVVQQVFDLCEDAYLIHTAYDLDQDALVLKSAYGLDKSFDGLQKYFGIKPFRMTLKLNDFPSELLDKAHNKKLNRFNKDGLHYMSGGLLSKKLGRMVENFLGINEVYVMGICWNERIYGSIGILSKKEISEEKQVLIETIINQSAIAIQRLYTSEQLKRSESRYRSLVEMSPDGIGLFKQDGEPVGCNHELACILGFENEDNFIQSKTNAYKIISRNDRSRVKKNMKLLVSGKVVPEQVYTMQRKDGSEFPAEIKSALVLDENSQSELVLSVVRDVTERIKAEEALAKYNEHLRSFAGHNEMVREQERLNLARDIHDILGSSLAGVKMELAILKQLLSVDILRSRPEISEQIHSMEGQIDESVETMRKMVRELRPGILDELGLVEAIHWYSGEIKKRSGLATKLKIEQEETGMDSSQSVVVFRIFQEIMTNIVLHAHASQVKIEISRPAGNLFRLVVSDNGIGMSEDEVSDPNSFGLIGMKERALLLDGNVKIESRLGSGTTIIVNIPVPIDKLSNN
jgi:PAS domain S-box-containing protein